MDHVCRVTYKRDVFFKPREIKTPDDYRPGTVKGKIDGHDIWIVEIRMPKSLMGNFKTGQELSTDKKNFEPTGSDLTADE